MVTILKTLLLMQVSERRTALDIIDIGDSSEQYVRLFVGDVFS